MEKFKVKTWHIFTLLTIVGVLAGGAGGFIAGTLFSTPGVKTEVSVIEAEGDVISKVADNIGASVVSIVTEQTNSTSNIFNIFGGSQSYTTQAAGTGVIVSGDGYVITNKHVIPDTVTKVTVVLRDGTSYEDVTVVDRDPTNDIAFLKINDVKDLPAAEIGDSSELKIGTKVIAVGNALGEFQNTVTSGIVSGLSRNITVNDGSSMSGQTLSDLIQTDAAINSGNSGGPLVTYDGKVVGITTAVASGADNIGFAIPSDSFRNLIQGVISKGKIEKPYLGVYYTMITKDIAKDRNLIVEDGAYIGYNNQKPTVDGSPADKAGLKAGDIITKIDDHELTEKNTLSSVISRYNSGDKVTLTILRDGATITVDLTLDTYKE
ncbi:trypsin-like peptidase domain-containing protein [Ruminococcaceae bacterium OttesenSCG-928-A11]|nr:trypsin-like peptidase domain-containing protein [Ruminococcaceae bacterium OttesenSCG-928-A11]